MCYSFEGFSHLLSRKMLGNPHGFNLKHVCNKSSKHQCAHPSLRALHHLTTRLFGWNFPSGDIWRMAFPNKRSSRLDTPSSWTPFLWSIFIKSPHIPDKHLGPTPLACYGHFKVTLNSRRPRPMQKLGPRNWWASRDWFRSLESEYQIRAPRFQ